MMKKLRNSILILLAAILLGYLLMVAVYALPLDWTGEPHDATIQGLKSTGMYPKDPFSGRQIDNYADSVSMLLASYPGEESAWKKAACNYYMSYDGEDVYRSEKTPYDYLIGNYDPAKAHPGAASYARYWHGSQLLLKPLMSFFSFSQIRRINFALILLAAGIAAFLLARRLPRTVPAFLLAIMLLAPTTIGRTVEFSCVVFVMLLTVIALLGGKAFSEPGSDRVVYLFLGAGIATAFVDFLTAPTITLTIPLVLLCQLRRGEKGLLRLVVECVFLWGVGYAGMWGGKWAIALIADGGSFYADLKEAILLRTSTTEWASRTGAIRKCFKEVFSTGCLNAAFVLLGLWALAQDFRHRRELTREELRQNLLYLIPAVIPLVWYCVLPEHSVRHYWFTYRTGTGTVFALLALADLRDASRIDWQILRSIDWKAARTIPLILIAAIIGGYLLMVAAYAVPLDWSGPNYDKTVAQMKKEKMYPKELYSNRQQDNFSDAIMMLMASYKGDEGPWRQAAANYYISYGGDDFYHLKTYPYDWLVGNYDPDTAVPSRMEYGRYWHGYIVVLRPLMKFFSYPQIRKINSAALLFLICLTLMVLRRRLPATFLPFSLMLLFLAPTSIGKCLEFSGDIYTMLLACLVLLCADYRLAGQRIRYFYLIVGILTPFAGFFTSPTLTLTVPLVLMCQLRYGQKNLARLTAECILFWGIGYVGMWAGKWVVAVLLERQEFLGNLRTAVKLRSSLGGASRLTGLKRCLKEFFNNRFLDMLLLSFAALTAAEFPLDHRKIRPEALRHNLLYLVPVVLVCAWCLFFSNHVYIHSWFTFRHIGVFVLSIFAFLDLSGRTPANNNKTEINDGTDDIDALPE